ncbi:MAG: SUMF1/EgtB/PvdO family nonheme iron enzyme [Armatimonadetes bacterium]|nr:SUMF1/EgtB/PvdO family nonheme iron enzyme [Armatimonadota bacterium]
MKNRGPGVIGLAVGMATLVGLAGALLLRHPSRGRPDRAKMEINPIDGAEMVYIPAGEFIMGRDKGEDDEKPMHTVYLDSYWIYKYEVTVAQYRSFCQATNRKMPRAPDWGWKKNHPIVNVSWHDAKAYCDWACVQLPTEAQWEKAARGTDGRIYPWGNEMDRDRRRCAEGFFTLFGGTKPVGSYPSGVSPFGVYDLAGNVWEWCADRYDRDYYKISPSRNPAGPGPGECRVLRGGSWHSANINFTSTRASDWPINRDNIDGFRCAQPQE